MFWDFKLDGDLHAEEEQTGQEQIVSQGSWAGASSISPITLFRALACICMRETWISISKIVFDWTETIENKMLFLRNKSTTEQWGEGILQHYSTRNSCSDNFFLPNWSQDVTLTISCWRRWTYCLQKQICPRKRNQCQGQSRLKCDPWAESSFVVHWARMN